MPLISNKSRGRVSAKAFNALARWARSHEEGMRAKPLEYPRFGGATMFIKNNAGAAIDRFSVLGCDSILYTPTENLDGFKSQPCLVGVKPLTTTHVGKFVVTLDGGPAGALIECLVSGVGICQVSMTASGDKFADITDGDETKLTSAASGAAQIIYAEAGTGTKWCLVRFPAGGPSAGAFMVTCAKDGPASGNGTPAGSGTPTTAASYTYTLTAIAHPHATLVDKNGRTATGIAQAYPRTVGRTVAATKGLVDYNEDGSFRLHAWEVPYLGGCAVPE